MVPGGKVKIIRNKEKWKHKYINKLKGYLLHKITEDVLWSLHIKRELNHMTTKSVKGERKTNQITCYKVCALFGKKIIHLY